MCLCALKTCGTGLLFLFLDSLLSFLLRIIFGIRRFVVLVRGVWPQIPVSGIAVFLFLCVLLLITSQTERERERSECRELITLFVNFVQWPTGARTTYSWKHTLTGVLHHQLKRHYSFLQSCETLRKNVSLQKPNLPHAVCLLDFPEPRNSPGSSQFFSSQKGKPLARQPKTNRI